MKCIKVGKIIQSEIVKMILAFLCLFSDVINQNSQQLSNNNNKLEGNASVIEM